MAFVVLIHATFDTKADADFIYDQAKQVATTASVARIGSAATLRRGPSDRAIAGN